MEPQVTICYFGIYDPFYSRNAILLQGLPESGAVVDECRVDPKTHPGISKYVQLWKQARLLDRKKYTYVIVAFPGHTVVWLAWLIFGRARIVFDAFVSLHDSNVSDRNRYSPASFSGARDWFLDWYSSSLASTVLLDTHSHIDYFVRAFGVSRSKFITVYVGANTSIFVPLQKRTPDKPFRVYFHGTYIPLQGIQFIVEAARLLAHEDILFTLVGNGQEYGKISKQVEEAKLTKLELRPSATLAELASYIADQDVCLGIFGLSDKAARVIPNKVYEYAAMERCIITQDSAGIRELFTDQENIYLVQAGTPEAIAHAIVTLKENAVLRTTLAKNAYTVAASVSPIRLAQGLLIELAARISQK